MFLEREKNMVEKLCFSIFLLYTNNEISRLLLFMVSVLLCNLNCSHCLQIPRKCAVLDHRVQLMKTKPLATEEEIKSLRLFPHQCHKQIKEALNQVFVVMQTKILKDAQLTESVLKKNTEFGQSGLCGLIGPKTCQEF